MKSLLCRALLASMSLLISALLLSAGHLYGQPSKTKSPESLVSSSTSPAGEKPVYPGGQPYTKRAGSFAQWTISTQQISDKEGKEGTATTQAEGNAGKTGGQPAVLQVVTVTKTGETFRIEQENATGQKLTNWTQGQQQILVWPDGIRCAEIVVYSDSEASAYSFNTSVTDYPGFEWVTPGNFRTTATYADKSCLVYQEHQVASRDDSGKPIAYITLTACVEADSRKPVALQRGDLVMTYEWKEAPTGALVLPANVQALIKERGAALRQLTTQGVKPF